MQKTYQFIDVVNGVSHSHKTVMAPRRPTNTPSLVEIGSQVALPHNDKRLRFYAWGIV